MSAMSFRVLPLRSPQGLASSRLPLQASFHPSTAWVGSPRLPFRSAGFRSQALPSPPLHSRAGKVCRSTSRDCTPLVRKSRLVCPCGPVGSWTIHLPGTPSLPFEGESCGASAFLSSRSQSLPCLPFEAMGIRTTRVLAAPKRSMPDLVNPCLPFLGSERQPDPRPSFTSRVAASHVCQPDPGEPAAIHSEPRLA